MRTAAFDYALPDELIASRPLERRDAGRMCVVERDQCRHALVNELPNWLGPGDLVVLNETRVRRARLACHRKRAGDQKGGKAELLFLERVDAASAGQTSRAEADEYWLVLGRANKPLRVGDRLEVADREFVVTERREQGTLVVSTQGEVERLLERVGQMPIPPYMRREADEHDVERYQTVFAAQMGSAAAPTAGLHLTDEALERIRETGAELGQLVLHVGIGTFRPVAVDNLEDHPMHSERISVSEHLCEQVRRVRESGGRVVAIGTTAVRALEAARDPDQPGFIEPTVGETRLLIQPGYRFSVVDALLTNFHMPKSTLLALVSAFAGYERTMKAYEEAVERRYRFLSYGDAMWIPECLTRGQP